MEFLWWLVGVLCMWTAIKFVFMVFKRLGSKSNMNDLLDRAEDNLGEAADKVAGYWKQRKNRKEKDQPIVTIR